MKAIKFLIIILAFTACATQDGITYKTAVRAHSIPAEYDWVKSHYRHCVILGQRLTIVNKVPYDVLKIKTKSGEIKDIHFNISKFY